MLTFWKFLLDSINAHGIKDHFYKSTSVSCCDYLVDFEPKFEFVKFENLVDLIDELHCKLLLSEIITCFYYKPNQFPSLKFSIRRIVSDPFFLLLRSFFKNDVSGSFKLLLLSFLNWSDNRSIARNTHLSFKISNMGLVMIIIHDLILTVPNYFYQSSVLIHIFFSFIDFW